MATAAATAPFTTAVAVGKDWVPRLSLAAVERLRDDMIVAAGRCAVPKARLLAAWVLGKQLRADAIFRPAPDASPAATTLVAAYRTSLSRTRSGVAAFEAARAFVPAQRVMLLRPIKTSGGVTALRRRRAAAAAAATSDPEAPPPPPARAFEAVWVDAAALAAEGILLSTRMGLDHMPDYSVAVLRRLARGEYDGAGGGGIIPVAAARALVDDGTLPAPKPPRGKAAASAAAAATMTTPPPVLARMSSKRRTTSADLLDLAEEEERKTDVKRRGPGAEV